MRPFVFATVRFLCISFALPEYGGSRNVVRHVKKTIQANEGPNGETNPESRLKSDPSSRLALRNLHTSRVPGYQTAAAVQTAVRREMAQYLEAPRFDSSISISIQHRVYRLLAIRRRMCSMAETMRPDTRGRALRQIFSQVSGGADCEKKKSMLTRRTFICKKWRKREAGAPVSQYLNNGQ